MFCSKNKIVRISPLDGLIDFSSQLSHTLLSCATQFCQWVKYLVLASAREQKSLAENGQEVTHNKRLIYFHGTMRKFCCLKKCLFHKNTINLFFSVSSCFSQKERKNLTGCLQYGPPPFIRPLTLNREIFLWTKLGELAGFCCSRL